MNAETQAQLEECIRRVTGQGVRQWQAAQGSSFSETAMLVLQNEQKAFLKFSQTTNACFAAEAVGLQRLRQAKALLVPEVLACADLPSAGSFLLMEYLEISFPTVNDEVKLGQGLAQLHRVHASQFGFDSDNFIGATPQWNRQCSNWGEFFFEQRLLFQAKLGQQRGWLNASEIDRLSTSREYLVGRLTEHRPQPSLLHGDLWSGNVLFTARGPAIIDPALYFGDREADLAFSELFGGFSRRMYQAYEEVWPLAPGYGNRKRLLNLYHLMNHANLFGGSYVQQVQKELRKISES